MRYIGILLAALLLWAAAGCGGGGTAVDTPDDGPSIADNFSKWTINSDKTASNGGWASGFNDTFTLYASNDDIEIGTVTFSAGATALHVTYETWDDWYMSDVHLDFFPCNEEGTPPDDYKPKPGQMFMVSEDDIDVQTYTFDVDYDELLAYLQEWDETIDCLPWYTECGLCFVAHAAVFRVLDEECGTQWASEVCGWDQGTRKDGTPVLPNRSDPEDALGEPDSFNGNVHFYSLGFDLVEDEYTDAWICLGYENDLYNGPAVDITTIEITWGDGYPAECAEVYVWDKVTETWVFCGVVTNIDDGTDENWDTANIPPGVVPDNRIKLVDCTDPSIHNSAADGFDLDALRVTYFCTQDETAYAGCHKEGGKGAKWWRWCCWQMHKAWPTDVVYYQLRNQPPPCYWDAYFDGARWPDGDFWIDHGDHNDYFCGWCAAGQIYIQGYWNPSTNWYPVYLIDSYDPNAPWHNGEWDKVNYLLTRWMDGVYVLDTVAKSNAFQRALWYCLGETGSTGAYDAALYAAATLDADTYGDGFIPTCGDYLALILYDAGQGYSTPYTSPGWPGFPAPRFQVNFIVVDP